MTFYQICGYTLAPSDELPGDLQIIRKVDGPAIEADFANLPKDDFFNTRRYDFKGWSFDILTGYQQQLDEVRGRFPKNPHISVKVSDLLRANNQTVQSFSKPNLSMAFEFRVIFTPQLGGVNIAENIFHCDLACFYKNSNIESPLIGEAKSAAKGFRQEILSLSNRAIFLSYAPIAGW